MAIRGVGRTKAWIVLGCAVALSLVAACGGASGTPGSASLGPVATPGASVPTSEPTTPTVTPIATTAAVCVTAPSGIVAWWRAENDAHDAVGGHDGTLEAGAAFTDGKVGRAFNFDGTSQYVSVAPSTAFQLKAAITIEGWVSAKAFGSYSGIAGTWDDNTGANRTYLFWVLGQSLELVVSPDSATYQRATDPTALPTGQWVHVAATYDGTTIRLYRDGAQVASTEYPGHIAVNDKAFLIGLTEGGGVGPNFWNGAIDELTVYDRALTAAELAGISGAGSAGKCRS